MTDFVVVKLKTLIDNQKLSKTLSELYYREELINQGFEIDKPIKIDYYGLDLYPEDWYDSVALQNKIIAYFSPFQEEYREARIHREANPIIQEYRGKPGQKFDECIKDCIHKARLDVLSAHQLNLLWTRWVFKFHFNASEFLFDPMHFHAFKQLKTQVSRVVNR